MNYIGKSIFILIPILMVGYFTFLIMGNEEKPQDTIDPVRSHDSIISHKPNTPLTDSFSGSPSMVLGNNGDFRLITRSKIDSPSILTHNAINARGSYYTYKGKYFRTYFCYLDSHDLRVYVNYFDHETGSFGNRVNWGKPRKGATDVHAKPNIILSPKGHILIAQEKLGGPQPLNHNSPIHIRRSLFSEDIGEWMPTKYSPLSHEICYPAFAKRDSVLFMLFGHGAAAIEHDHSALIRSFDDGKSWYDLNGQLMNGSDRVPSPYVIDLQANNHWSYQHIQEVPGGIAIILNAQNKGTNNAYPLSYLMFSKNGESWHNWESWINNGKKGFKHNVLDSGPVLQASLDEHYAISGDGKYDVYSDRRVFNFTITGKTLVYIREDGYRVQNGPVHYYSDHIFTMIDKNGNKTEKSFKEATGINDTDIEYYFYPSILAISENTIDVFIANGKRGRVERWRTEDNGESFYKIMDLNNIGVGYHGESLSKLVYRHSPHSEGVFMCMSDCSGHDKKIDLSIFQWMEEGHFDKENAVDPLNEGSATEMKVHTLHPKIIISSTVKLRGELVNTNISKSKIREVGFCWGEKGQLDTSNNRIVTEIRKGYFNETLSKSVFPSITYFYRSYCLTENELLYGELRSFKMPAILQDPINIENLRLWLDAADINGNGIPDTAEVEMESKQPDFWIDKVKKEVFRAVGDVKISQTPGNLKSIECDVNDYFVADKDSSHWGWLHHNDITTVIRMSLKNTSSKNQQVILSTAGNPLGIGFKQAWSGQKFRNDLGDMAVYNYSGGSRTKTFIGVVRETSKYWETDNTFRNVIMTMDHDVIPIDNHECVQVYIDGEKTPLNREDVGTDQSPVRVDPTYPLTIMGDPGNTHHFSGNISEILIYDRQLNELEISRIFEYLDSKYP